MTEEVVFLGHHERRGVDQRAVADTYRAETLARFNGEGPTALWSSNGGVIVVVGNLLHILDVECEILRETIDFDEVDEATGLTPTPTLVAWTADGGMFVVADKCGFLRLFNASGTVILSTRVLTPDAVLAGHSFQALSFSGDLFAVSSEMLYRVRPDGGSVPSVETVRLASQPVSPPERSVGLRQFPPRLILPSQAIPTIRAPGRIALVGTREAGSISLWDTRTDESGAQVTSHTADVAACAQMGIHKVRFDATGNHMIVLDNVGGLSLWSTTLWVMLSHWDGVHAVDMEIVPDPSYQGHITVALTTKAETGTGLVISIRQIPAFIEVCRFPTLHAVLGCARDLQGRVLLLEKPDDSVSEYHLQCLRPSVPTHRLQELLAALRFADAETLVKEHELSHELYLRPLAEHHLQLLKNGTGSIEDALAIIHRIESKEFAAELCLHCAAPPCSADARRLIDTAAEIARKHGFKEVLSEADALVRRFTTYQQIGEEPFDGDGWTWFRDVPLREAMYIHLQAGDLQGARVIWRRHAAEEDLANGFEEIMAGVPPTMRPEDVLDWLATEVVPSLDVDTLARLSTWVQFHARLLEQCPGWLKVAAQFAHLADTTMECMGLVIDPSLQRLQRELDDLVYLEEAHAVRFMLAEYSTLSCVDVALRLLDRVPTADLLTDEIENHVRPYLSRHNEDADVVLGEYALEMIEEGSIYIDRAVAALRAVRSVKERTRILLEVAAELTVSQSSELATLMQDTLEGNSGALATQLRQQHKLLELRQLVNRYGIRRYEVADPHQATALLHHILSQTDCPDSLTDAERIAEFYHHLSPHAARVEQIQNHINEGNIPTALAAFARMDIEDAQAVAHDVLSGLLEDLDSEESEEHQRRTVAAAIKVATALLEREGYSADSAACEAELSLTEETMLETTKESLAAMLAGLVTIQHLQSAGMFIGLRSLVSPTLREDALRTLVSTISLQTSDQKGPSLTAILSLADHLGMPRVNALRVVAMEACNSPWHKLAIDACESLVARESTALTARTLCFVASALLRQFYEHVDAWGASAGAGENLPHALLEISACQARKVLSLPKSLIDLLGAALITCGDDNMAECLKLLGECETAEAVVAQCDMADTQAYETASPQQDNMSSSSSDWRAHPSHYREDATVLVPSEALSALAAAHLEIEELEVKCLDSRTLLQQDENEEDVFQEIESPHTDALLLLLQRNGANQLALRFAARSSTTMAMVAPWQGSKVAPAETSAAALVNKVLRAREVDGALAVGYMLECSGDSEGGHKPLQQLLARTSPQWMRAAALAIVGMETAMLQGLGENVEAYKLFKCRAILLARLAQGGVGFDGVALRRFFTFEALEPSDTEAVQGVVVPLLEMCNSDLATAFSFGTAFSLDLDMVREKYIEYHMTSSTQNFKELILKVVDDMDPAKLVRLMKEVIFKVSPYDYARLTFAVRILKHCEPSLTELCKRHHAVLEILSAYRRVSHPSGEEIAENCHGRAADKWAAQRLPFTALIKAPEAVVALELCLEAIDRLIPLVVVLELDVDALHVTLSRQLVAAGASPSDVATSIRGIREHSLKISTAEELALASESAATRVNGLQFALSLAQEWKHTSQESEAFTEAASSVERLSKSVADACTQQLLTESGYERLLEGNPSVEAILYRLCDEHTPCNPAQPDSTDASLHQLFARLAVLHGLNPDEERHKIIKRWLHTGATATMPAAGVHATPGKRVSCLESTPCEDKAHAEEAAVRRIVFMMAQGDVVANARMLFLYAHSQDVTVPTRARAWALRALMIVASAGVGGLSVDSLPSPVEDMKQRLHHLRHVEMLEELQIPVTLEELETCSKPGLVRSLWKERGSEGGVAQLVCDMCLEYNINDAQLWGEVLAKLNAMGEVPFLIRALKRVLQLPCCRKIPKLAHIWQSTAAAPLAALQTHEGPLNSAAHKTLALAVHLACSGPMDPMPDMRPAVDVLMQNSQGELAVQCMLVIIDTQQRNEALAKLLDAGLAVPILHQLPPYLAQSSASVKGMQSMSRHVYEYMNRHSSHLDMYSCSLGHQRAFLVFVLQTGNITNALKALIKAGKVDDAYSVLVAAGGADAGSMLLPEYKRTQLQKFLEGVANSGCENLVNKPETAEWVTSTSA